MQNNRSISIRLPEQLLEAIDQRAKRRRSDRTQVIRDAIVKYLGVAVDEEDRLTLLEAKVEELSEKVDRLSRD